MLNAGSTALPYEPYGYQVPIMVEGKNLLPTITATNSKNGILLRSESDGTVIVNGTATANTFLPLKENISYPFDTFLSGCPQGGSLGYCLRAITPSKIYADYGSGILIPANTEVYIEIRIENGFECNNLEFKPMFRRADIEDDTYEPYYAPVTTPIYLPEPIKMVGGEAEFIDYAEQKMHRIGAEDIDVILPALPTLPGTNTFSANTSIQPSNIYIKDSFDYKKVFTATRTIEDELPLNYRNIEDNDSTLDNYRIYGNTVGGESVGDRTGNLFDENSDSVPGFINDDGYITQAGNPITTYDYTNVTPAENYYIKICGKMSEMVMLRKIRIAYYSQDKRFLSRVVLERLDNGTTFETPNNCYYIRLSIDDGNTNIMLNTGSTPLPYEPYGYKVPVTISNDTDTLTTPIYLPEPIKMVGDEAEYIDYSEQKQHRVRKNLFYITKFTNNNTQCTVHGVNFSIIDNEVYANGTSTVMYPQAMGFDYVLTEGETYAATLYIEGEYTGLPYIYCTTTYDSAGNYQKVPPNVRTIFTALPDTRILFVAQGTGESFNIKYKLLITKATIEDDTYEPYIENTDLDVTLPALPTLPETNVLSVGTAVQPSEVEIKGKIKEIN